MKKLALILGLFCSLAMAENTASNPVNKTITNNNSQPKLIMVKGASSNQNSYKAPTQHVSKKHTSHAKKSKSHEHVTSQKETKKTKQTKNSTKKVTHKSKATKKTSN